jgi:acetyl-CoA carboxylase biotin carboxyl carrier protein
LSKKKATTKVPAVSAPKAKLSGSPMDVDLLEQIVKLMSANDLNTVDVRDGEKRVILKRGAVQQMVQYAPAAAGFATGPAASAAGSASSASPTLAPPTAADEDAKLIPIKSPMVGTFYAAPSPGSKPYVSVGSSLSEETEVCTIEAMKNFLPIKAEVTGTIAKILVTDGQTVQFGQVLFLVKP